MKIATDAVTADFSKQIISCNSIIEKIKKFIEKCPEGEPKDSSKDYDLNEIKNEWSQVLGILPSENLQADDKNTADILKEFFEKMDDYIIKDEIGFWITNDKGVSCFPETSRKTQVIKFLEENLKGKSKPAGKIENKSNLWFWMFMSGCGTLAFILVVFGVMVTKTKSD